MIERLSLQQIQFGLHICRPFASWRQVSASANAKHFIHGQKLPLLLAALAGIASYLHRVHVIEPAKPREGIKE